jgi:hypothetical protein
LTEQIARLETAYVDTVPLPTPQGRKIELTFQPLFVRRKERGLVEHHAPAAVPFFCDT